MPGLSIHYSLTDREHSEIEQARSELARAAGVLGEFVRGGEPRLLPSGSFLHYQGTYRIGSRDDGTCVCDPDSRVWGIDGLVLGGNGLIPTATACNPTLTSVALAILGARRVVRDHTATIGRRATVG
jgi:choline dehydrogenase-like flavoprotein